MKSEHRELVHEVGGCVEATGRMLKSRKTLDNGDDLAQLAEALELSAAALRKINKLNVKESHEKHGL